jgi:hypothetical protein
MMAAHDRWTRKGRDEWGAQLAVALTGVAVFVLACALAANLAAGAYWMFKAAGGL